MSATATPDPTPAPTAPPLDLDAYLRHLRGANPLENPWATIEGGDKAWAAFAVVTAAVADFVDACRVHVSYPDALEALDELVDFFPAPPTTPPIPASLALSAEDVAYLIHGRGDEAPESDPTLF